MAASWHVFRPYAGWLVVLMVALALAVLALDPARAQDDDPPLSQGQVAFAEASYANVCAECHGGDGRGAIVPGTDERAPALADTESVTAAYVDLVLRTGRMPPAGDPFDNREREIFYTDDERRAVVEWMTDRFDLAEDIPTVDDGDVAVGLEAFALNCAHCHGNAGGGGTAGENAWTPRVSDLDPITVAEAIRVGPFEMPAFSEEVLSQREVNGIASYLQAVDAEQGTPILGLVELNPVFASGFVAVLALSLLGSLLYIGGRPIGLNSDAADPLEGEIDEPARTTPMPGDPAYEAAVEEAVPGEKGVPYRDEGTRSVTTGEDSRPTAERQDSDDPDGPAPDEPSS